MEVKRHLDDAGQTESLGEAIARALRPGDVVTLDGPLGAGKTTLVRAIAAAWGADPARVSSPTFVLMHEYESPRGRLVHVDAYRMSGPGDLEDLDLATFARGAVVLVEWAERLGPGGLGGAARGAGHASEAGEGETIRVRLDHAAAGGRTARLDVPEGVLARPEAAALARGDTLCPVTGVRVRGSSPSWPFASEKARLADLHRWFSGEYGVPTKEEPGEAEA